MGRRRDGPVAPTFKEGGVLREEDGLEAAMGSKGTNLFFVGIKTAPLVVGVGWSERQCPPDSQFRRGKPK